MMSPSPEHFVVGDLSDFPLLEGCAYLNHAAISPPSRQVTAKVKQTLDRFARDGSSAFLDVVEERTRLKARLASILNAPSIDGEDFAWMPNTTSAVQAIAHAFPWRANGDIVLFDGEFPTNVIPWEQAAKREGLTLRRASLLPLMRDGGADLSEIESLLRRGVQLLAISAVQFQTGLRAPLDELSALCKRYGTSLFLDGIQACGSTPIPLDHVDFMASGGHKWMMAVEGAGFLYVHPKWRGQLKPEQAGWLSVEEPLDFLFSERSILRYDKPIRNEMSAFEGGAQSALCYAALEASTRALAMLTVPVIYNHIQGLLDVLEQGLLDLGFESARRSDPSRRSAILAVRPPEDHPLKITDYAASLLEQKITVSTPDGWLRFSPHWPNNIEQIHYTLDAIAALHSS